MSRNTHEPNASPAHGSHQADYISDLISDYHTKFCCTCRDRVACLVGWTICPNSGHKFCEMCSAIDSGSENRAWSPFSLRHRASDEVRRAMAEPRYMSPSTPKSLPLPPPHPAVVSDPNQSRELNGHEERNPLEEAKNEANKEQQHEIRSQGENTGKQQLFPKPGRNKRKLNTEKCQRCREDKKGCTWKSSEKCDRCTEKGLSCSEKTRVIRPRKHASNHVSPVRDAISPSVDSSEFEDRFNKWAFLKSYHKMLIMAMDRFEGLERKIESIFQSHVLSRRVRTITRWEFERFVSQVRDALDLALDKIITTENGLEGFLARSLTGNQSLALLVSSSDTLCPECRPEYLKPTISKAIESLDVCGAFLAQQHVFSEHWWLFDPVENDDADDLLDKEIERYNRFSAQIPQQAGAILESLGWSDAATYSRSLGLFHFDIEWTTDILLQLKSTDCLGRTPLHRFQDGISDNDAMFPEFYNNGIESSWWNSRDILGRTPLHILCQSMWLDNFVAEVKTMLEKGADPGLITVYGHIPLHYAAVGGYVGTCQILMEHMSKSDIGIRDGRGKTALDWAIVKNHPNVVDLLMDRYKEAGLDREIESALKIKQGIENGLRYD